MLNILLSWGQLLISFVNLICTSWFLKINGKVKDSKYQTIIILIFCLFIMINRISDLTTIQVISRRRDDLNRHNFKHIFLIFGCLLIIEKDKEIQAKFKKCGNAVNKIRDDLISKARSQALLRLFEVSKEEDNHYFHPEIMQKHLEMINPELTENIKDYLKKVTYIECLLRIDGYTFTAFINQCFVLFNNSFNDYNINVIEYDPSLHLLKDKYGYPECEMKFVHLDMSAVNKNKRKINKHFCALAYFIYGILRNFHSFGVLEDNVRFDKTSIPLTWVEYREILHPFIDSMEYYRVIFDISTNMIIKYDNLPKFYNFQDWSRLAYRMSSADIHSKHYSPDKPFDYSAYYKILGKDKSLKYYLYIGSARKSHNLRPLRKYGSEYRSEYMSERMCTFNFNLNWRHWLSSTAGPAIEHYSRPAIFIIKIHKVSKDDVMKFRSDNKTYLAKHLSVFFFKSRIQSSKEPSTGPLMGLFMEILKDEAPPIVSVIRYLNGSMK